MTDMEIGWSFICLKAHLLITYYLKWVGFISNPNSLCFCAENDLCLRCYDTFGEDSVSFGFPGPPKLSWQCHWCPQCSGEVRHVGFSRPPLEPRSQWSPKKRQPKHQGLESERRGDDDCDDVWDVCFFFSPMIVESFLEMECGTAVASCLKKACWQELQQLGISIFNRTSGSLGKMVHLEPLHDSESSSYIKLPWWNSERSSCSLAMSWFFPCFFLMVCFLSGSSAEESWPWCGIPCGLGHCEGLSGGNQQLPCKAAQSRLPAGRSVGTAGWCFKTKKSVDQACCRSREDGSENSISFKTCFCWSVGFWDVVGSNTKNHRTLPKNWPRRLPERGISHGRAARRFGLTVCWKMVLLVDPGANPAAGVGLAMLMLGVSGGFCVLVLCRWRWSDSWLTLRKGVEKQQFFEISHQVWRRYSQWSCLVDTRCMTRVGESRQVPELLAIAGHWSKGPQMVGQFFRGQGRHEECPCCASFEMNWLSTPIHSQFKPFVHILSLKPNWRYLLTLSHLDSVLDNHFWMKTHSFKMIYQSDI